MLLPMEIGDYTDFFSSMHHAKNCGTIFRGPANPVPANWYVILKSTSKQGIVSVLTLVYYSIFHLQVYRVVPYSGFIFPLHIMDEHHLLSSLEQTLSGQGWRNNFH